MRNLDSTEDFAHMDGKWEVAFGPILEVFQTLSVFQSKFSPKLSFATKMISALTRVGSLSSAF